MVARKVTLDRDGAEVEQSPAAVFERGVMSSGEERIFLDVPDQHPDLLRRLCELLPPPFYVLYVLHTPRGEGEAGRYQSAELSMDQLSAFLRRYSSYFYADARHDLWVYSITSRQTLIWDRHNRLFAEGEPLGVVADALISLGFTEGAVPPLGDHYHHYRSDFDDDATAVLAEFDWRRTPLRSEDEQRPPLSETVH
ncbi:MAG TPA: hypothetical protein VGF50_02490 [Caulobacteraceae bacterium]